MERRGCYKKKKDLIFGYGICISLLYCKCILSTFCYLIFLMRIIHTFHFFGNRLLRKFNFQSFSNYSLRQNKVNHFMPNISSCSYIHLFVTYPREKGKQNHGVIVGTNANIQCVHRICQKFSPPPPLIWKMHRNSKYLFIQFKRNFF